MLERLSFQLEDFFGAAFKISVGSQAFKLIARFMILPGKSPAHKSQPKVRVTISPFRRQFSPARRCRARWRRASWRLSARGLRRRRRRGSRRRRTRYRKHVSHIDRRGQARHYGFRKILFPDTYRHKFSRAFHDSLRPLSDSYFILAFSTTHDSCSL